MSNRSQGMIRSEWWLMSATDFGIQTLFPARAPYLLMMKLPWSTINQLWSHYQMRRTLCLAHNIVFPTRNSVDRAKTKFSSDHPTSKIEWRKLRTQLLTCRQYLQLTLAPYNWLANLVWMDTDPTRYVPNSLIQHWHWQKSLILIWRKPILSCCLATVHWSF